MAFLETAFVALLAPAGAAGLWLLQRKDRTDDRLTKEKELKRAKAEEVFEALNNLVSNYAAQTIHAMQLLADKRPAQSPDPPSAARVDALLSIYFPNCIPHLEAFNADCRKIYEAVVLELRKIIDGGGAGKEIAAVHVGMAHKMQKRVVTFSETLREAMKDEIGKLW